MELLNRKGHARSMVLQYIIVIFQKQYYLEMFHLYLFPAELTVVRKDFI